MDDKEIENELTKIVTISHLHPQMRVRLILEVLESHGYVRVRKGDIYWTREQLSAPDYAKDYYKE